MLNESLPLDSAGESSFLKNATSRIFDIDPRVCDFIEEGIETVIKEHNSLRESIISDVNIVFPCFLLGFSLVISFFGATLIRLAAAVSAFILVSSVVFLVGQHNMDLNCETIIITSSACGLIGSCVAICVYRTGLIALGIASFTSTVHLLFDTFPVLHTGFDQPSLFGMSALYWAAMVLSGTIGGCLIRKQEKAIMELTTSVLGGAIAGYSVHKILLGTGTDMPSWIPILSALGVGSLGLIFQRSRRLGQHEARDVESERR